MRDGEYLFHLSQRENRHSGAFHKRNGSKSRKCSLPSDNLTAKQREELNGPMKTYNLKKPMKWEEFKDMPDDLKKEYLLFLNRTYHASARRIAVMFGVPRNTLHYYLNTLSEDPRFILAGFRKPTPEWEKFIGGDVAGRESSEGTEEPVPVAPAVAEKMDEVLTAIKTRTEIPNLDDFESAEKDAPKANTKPELVVSAIRMTAVGTAEDLAFLLKSSLRSDKHYRLSFAATLQEVHEA